MPEPVLAHHLVEAIPFFTPVLVIVLGLGSLIVRDRRSERRDGG